MLPNDDRRPGRDGRRRPIRLAPVEALEDRRLMAYNSIGIPLPDLTIAATSAPVAAWGGPLTLDLTVSNRGAASLPEPNAIFAGSASAADAPATTVAVYASTRPHFGGRSVLVGTVAVPGVSQNSVQETLETITLPAQPKGFPGDGGKIYLEVKLDPTRQVDDRDRTDNTFILKQPVEIAAPLPDLKAITLSVPSTIQPGDAVAATVKVANYGTVDTDLQTPVVLDLVVSTDTNFGPGDIVVAQTTISNITPLSEVPSSRTVLGDVDVNDPSNVRTVTFPDAVLPGAPPTTYYLGVIVDPSNAIREIHEIGAGPSTTLSPAVLVGPPIANLPPAGIISATSSTGNVFPVPNGGSTGIATASVAAPGAAPTLATPVSPIVTDGPGVSFAATTAPASTTSAPSSKLSARTRVAHTS